MVKDLFERIQNNKGPLGKWASQAEGYFVFPKLEGELGPRMQFQGKNILLCTHGRTLLCLLTILNEHPLSKMYQYKHQNTCLYKVHYVGDEFIFELENDVRHLKH